MEGFAASASLDIDSHQQPFGMPGPVCGDKMAVAASYFNLDIDAFRKTCPEASNLFQSEHMGYDLFSPFFRARLTVIFRPRSRFPVSFEMAVEAWSREISTKE